MLDNESMDKALEKLPQLPVRPRSMLEKSRVAYLKCLGNPDLMAKELAIPIDEVYDQLKIIKKMQLGDSRVLVADNIAMNILSGLELMLYHLMEQYRVLVGRGQKMLSMCCGKPFKIVAATDTTPEHAVCLNCDSGCNTELVDDIAIFKVKNDTFGKIIQIYDVYRKTVIELGVLDDPDALPLVNVNQNVVIIDGKPQDYLRLPPMEMGMLLEDMKKELLTRRKKLEVLGEEIEAEEARFDEEDGFDKKKEADEAEEEAEEAE